MSRRTGRFFRSTRDHLSGLSRALGLAALLAFLAAPSGARAQQDPALCFESGPTIILGVFFSNGTTGVGVNTLTECETVVYKVTLLKSGGDTVCAFKGGTLSLTTPDGVVHDLTPPGGVPCLGGKGDNGSGCVNGQAPVTASLSYTVNPAHVVAGQIQATASYTGGVLFDAVPPTPGVSAGTPKSTPVSLCSDGLTCDGLETCNPLATSGPRKGLCVNGTPPTCTGTDQCNVASCQEPAGCTITPRPNGTVCSDVDVNACTSAACQAGTCKQDFSTISCPPDSNDCTEDPACNPTNGLCEHPNKPNGASCTDTDGDICSIPGCLAGACDQQFGANTSNPVCLCGNGVLDAGETCDPPNPNPGPGGVALCRGNCTFCGDGAVNGPGALAHPDHETCDDGNTDDAVDDNCRNDCTLPVCGDPAKIRFRTGKTDFLKVVGRIEPIEPFDPLGKPLSFTLSKGGVTVGQWTLPPTALKGLGKPPIKRYVVLQKGVGSLPGGGVQKLFIGRHNGAWRFTFVGFADLGAVDLAVPTQVMDTVLAIGTDEYSSGGTWKPVRSGWILQEQNAYPMCTIGLTPP